MKKRSLALLAFSLIAVPVLAQVPDLTLGGPVTPDRLPERYTQAPALTSLAALNASLDQAGDLTLDGAEFVIAPADSTPRTVHLTVRRLTLRRSRIVTNGHRFVIHARELASDNASVVQARAPEEVAQLALMTSALDGAPGRSGRSAGEVAVHLMRGIVSPFTLQLAGEDGESGTDGRPGAAGARGGRGRNAKARNGFCRQGQGRGHRGGNGGAGGRGGDAGAGGNGGRLTVTFYNTPVDVSMLRYDLEYGEAGAPGTGGAGGAAGRGGPPGKNTNPCKAIGAIFSLPKGEGAPGQAGAKGANGNAAANGQPGLFTASRTDLPPG